MQLKRLWEITPHLDRGYWAPLPGLPIYREVPPDHSRKAELAERFRCGEYRCVPLVIEELTLFCGVHILLLRPDKPGEIISSGDIDNRLKTLFDALRIPGPDENELGGQTPQDGENPFFCLLEDDK